MTEAELQAEVIRLCDKYRLYWHHDPDSRTVQGKKGFPDLVICGTQLIMAELKSQYGNVTTFQTDWRYRLQSAGVKHVVWRPSDLQEGTIERVLSEIQI
jgi:hypothetical protein